MLARRLLWNRAVGESSRPQPVVVLLGPTGSGKSEALRSISHDCGSGVVHNPPFDFNRTAPVTTVEALAQVAFDLSRRWPARKNPRFTRFALGLIAVQTQLGTLNRDHARESLRTALREFARNPLADRVADQVEPVTDAAGPFLDPALAGTVKLVLPRLIQAIGRRSLANAKRWHADIPEAEGASPLDALIHLNQRARVEPADVTAWLTSAFLADIRDNHTAMAVPDPHSPCSCDNPGRIPHLHNWLLLLDNIDHEGGSQFLADITNARERHLRQHDEHDALVIVATSGRWNPVWESDWYAPWKSSAGKPDQVRIVPRNRDADYQYWAGNSDIEHPRPDYYPVLLEPLNVEETARILGTSPYARESVLAQRASGGLPRAVQTLAPLLSSGEIQPGKRDTLWPTEPDAAGADLWRSRLEDLRLAEHLPDVDVEEFVAAAPFATAPWLVPAEATSLVSQPQAGRILTELRTALWVIAPTRDRGTEDSVELHPWIARTLLTSLANWTSPELPSYRTQFEALLNDPDTKRDRARTAYCQLALGRIGEVVSTFEYHFDLGPHQDWIEQLALVTNAPDDRPLHLDLVDIFHDLVDADLREVPRDRTPVRNILTRLLVADWLVANPFATPDPERKTIIVNAFSELAPLSRRPDVAALYEAAERASKLF